MNASSGRDAVIEGSFCRTDPAAEFRGLANSVSPRAPRSSFTRSKPDFVM